MKKPKQIIYPLSYHRGLLGSPAAASESERFCAALSALLGGGIGIVPLGRARMGIYLLTKGAIAGKRKKVVLSPYTIPDVVNMVVLAGGEPVFADSVRRSTNVDVARFEALLTDDVACAWVTHYHVNQNQLSELRSICARKGVLLFEDCAIALSGRIEGKHVGTDSDGAILSLSGFKFLNYYWGGCVLSRHADTMEGIRARTAGWRRLGILDYLPQMVKTLKYDVATRNPVFSLAVFPLLRMRQARSSEAVSLTPPRLESPNIDQTLESLPSGSALAEWNAKLHTLEGFLGHRRRIARIYDEHLLAHAVASETATAVREGSCFVNYPVHVGEAQRNRIYKKLMLAGYDVGASLYPNCHEHARFSGASGSSDNVRDLVRSVITLPTHPRVDEDYARELALLVLNEIGVQRAA